MIFVPPMEFSPSGRAVLPVAADSSGATLKSCKFHWNSMVVDSLRFSVSVNFPSLLWMSMLLSRINFYVVDSGICPIHYLASITIILLQDHICLCKHWVVEGEFPQHSNHGRFKRDPCPDRIISFLIWYVHKC